MTAVSGPWADRWFQALPRPVVALDLDGRVVGFNVAALDLLEIPAGELQGAMFAETALGDESRGGYAEITRRVLSGVAWSGDLSVAPGGSAADFPRSQLVQLRVVPVLDADVAVGLLLTVESVGNPNERASHLSERFTRLARVAAELQSAADIKVLGDVIVTHLADSAGATGASLSERLDEDTLALVAVSGGAPDTASRWATYPVDEYTPAGAVVISGEPLLIAGRDTLSPRYPHLELAADGERSLLCLPLVINGRPIGVVSLSYPTRVSIDDNEMEFYRVMADTCAQALDRIRALETVADQHEKLRFLAEASAELASSLDYESTLSNIAWLAVPGIADWCSIQLEQDGILRQLAVAHRDPEKIALAEEFQERYPTDPESETGAYGVLRSGVSQLIPEIPDEMIVEAALDDEHLAMIRSLDLKSALTVPLKTRDRTLGIISWVSGSEGRRFGPGDIPFGEDFARRAAIAIDNAQLHSELRDIAEQLQEAVLPPQLPEVDGWHLASSYSSAGRADVGGDFYDVIPLRDGRLAFTIGDVMGRGVDAAASMAQIRAALRAFVAVDPSPDAVLTRLDVLYEQFPSEQLVTLLYGVADPAEDRVHLVSAGHPAPLVGEPDGTWSTLEGLDGTVLGVQASERRSITVPLTPGQTLLLLTDGLLERRGEDVDLGRDRLLAEVATLPADLTGHELAALSERMRDPSRDDDVAVLAVTRTGAA